MEIKGLAEEALFYSPLSRFLLIVAPALPPPGKIGQEGMKIPYN